MVRTHRLPPDFRGGVQLVIPPYAIGSVPALSGHAICTDGVHCRESAGTGPVVLKVVPVTGAALASPTYQFMCASLSHDITKRLSQQTVTNVHRVKPTEVEVTKALKVMTNRNAGVSNDGMQ